MTAFALLAEAAAAGLTLRAEERAALTEAAAVWRAHEASDKLATQFLARWVQRSAAAALIGDDVADLTAAESVIRTRTGTHQTYRRKPSDPLHPAQCCLVWELGMTDATTDQSWTPQLVAERLAEAAGVLERMPEERARGHYDLWPRIVLEPSRGACPAAAAPEAIDRMDETLGWLCWLDPEERRLVWLRAEGMPWKRITHRLGIGRTTAWQRWTLALLKIATRLNAAAERNRPDTRPLNKRGSSAVESV